MFGLVMILMAWLMFRRMFYHPFRGYYGFGGFYDPWHRPMGFGPRPMDHGMRGPGMHGPGLRGPGRRF